MFVNQRVLLLWALAALHPGHNNSVHAFNSFPSVFGNTKQTPPPLKATLSPSEPSTDAIDVSVPYDAAARLAYDSWRIKFSKGDFSSEKYDVFRSNYETLTIANVVAARKEREGGDVTKRLELNEFADCTEAEYKMKSGGGTTQQTTDVMSQALQAAASQSGASAALGEASAALAEEEEKLAEALGLESVAELEVALDAMDGIAEDGGELSPTNVSREARIRAAYMDWCKDFSKEPDEDRFPVFSSNYLQMEDYAKENGVEMKLNQYADCTQEEYELRSGAKEKVDEGKVKAEEEVEEKR